MCLLRLCLTNAYRWSSQGKCRRYVLEDEYCRQESGGSDIKHLNHLGVQAQSDAADCGMLVGADDHGTNEHQQIRVSGHSPTHDQGMDSLAGNIHGQVAVVLQAEVVENVREQAALDTTSQPELVPGIDTTVAVLWPRTDLSGHLPHLGSEFLWAAEAGSDLSEALEDFLSLGLDGGGDQGGLPSV